MARIIPIDGTCSKNVAEFMTLIRYHLVIYLAECGDIQPKTWSIDFTTRNITNLEKASIISQIHDTFTGVVGGQDWKVDLNDPELSIMCELNQVSLSQFSMEMALRYFTV